MTRENEYLVSLALNHWWMENYAMIVKSSKEQGTQSCKPLETQYEQSFVYGPSV